jgi:diguanylate cyclase (GGDEF)-like protein
LFIVHLAGLPMRDHSSEPDLRILTFFQYAELPALAAVVIICLGTHLLSMAPGLVPHAMHGWWEMVWSSALALIALAVSLWLSGPGRGTVSMRASQLLGYAVFIMGVGTLLVYALAIDWPTNAVLRLPTPQTALAFVLLGFASANIHARRGALSRAVDLSAVAAIGVVLFLLAGYVFFIDDFVGLGPGDVTAQHTLVCLTILTLVIVARRAQEERLFAVLVGRGIGSQILRLVLPPVVLLPFVIFAVIGYLDGHKLLSVEYARAIAAPLEALAIIALFSWMAKHTNKLERELRRQSITDELTGVLNRRGFFAVADYTLRNAIRQRASLVLFYFDLDRLKEANDHFGHEAGSRLIKRFAELLSESFRSGDIVARLGGDEFVVLAAGDVTNADALLARLQQRVSENNQAGELPVTIAYSTGTIEVPPAANVSMEQLIARADALMYEQKQLKRRAA